VHGEGVSGRHLLLVEDDADARASLSRSLSREGFSCAAAASVDEALAAAKAAPFLDAVVTDVVLGSDDRGGIRLIGALRDAGVRAPVVIITAFAALSSVKQALNEGASYLLEKPFRAADLLEVLRRVTGEPASIGYLVDRALSKAGLTEKEESIARLILKGLTSAEIARLEGNSDKTVRQHITRIYAKCGVSSRPEFFHYVFPW
jgi:DNA-binding NarL/FixJ family response regulator